MSILLRLCLIVSDQAVNENKQQFVLTQQNKFVFHKSKLITRYILSCFENSEGFAFILWSSFVLVSLCIYFVSAYCLVHLLVHDTMSDWIMNQIFGFFQCYESRVHC